MDIYLFQNQGQVGPFTERQVRQGLTAGAIHQTDLAWHEGLTAWQPLNSIISIDASFPPPLPPRIPAPSPDPTAQTLQISSAEQATPTDTPTYRMAETGPPMLRPLATPASQGSTHILQQQAAEHLARAATFAFGSGKMSARAEKTICILIHLVGCVFWFVPPLILWMWKREDSRAVDMHGKEAVNFQLTFFVLTIVLGFISFGILALVAYLTSIILAAIAAANASQGRLYHYPLTYRAIK